MADVENVIIIGSGPAGYTAALYTARANLYPLVIEGFLWGGLLQQTTDVENYPGFPEGIMGPEIMQQHARPGRALRHALHHRQRDARRARRRTASRTRSGSTTRSYQARTVILAMGAEHKKLGVPGEEELDGRGVSYCATCDAAFFKDTRRRSSSAAATRRWRRRSSSPSSPRRSRSCTAATSSAPRRSCSTARARPRTSSC